MTYLISDKIFTKVLLIGLDPLWVKGMHNYLNQICFNPRLMVASSLNYVYDKIALSSRLYEYSPNVIFIDNGILNAPNLDVIKLLRKDYSCCELPIYLFSENDENFSAEAGINGFIYKSANHDLTKAKFKLLTDCDG